MKKSRTIVASGLMAGATFMLAATPAMAQGPRVDWSITVGSPGYYPPPVVYREPVYVEPSPVYVEEVPVVRYRGPYYGPHYVYHERREHHGHHHHDEDDD